MDPEKIEITVNGEARELPEGTSVAGLLELLDLRVEQIAVEVNQSIVRRADHERTPLHPGDAVEVVTLVGGG